MSRRIRRAGACFSISPWASEATIMTRHISGARVVRHASASAGTIAALAFIAACNNFDVQNLNAPTVETLTSSPTRDVLARTAIGIQTQLSTNIGGIIQQWGIYGREGWNLLGNDPRDTGEELHG